MRRAVVYILVGLAVVLFVLIAVPLGFLIYTGGFSRPIEFQVPAGYRGWAEVYYDDPTCPPLHTRGVFRVVTISVAGRGCAPSRLMERWTYERFVYVSPDGTRRSTDGHIPASDPETKRLFVFIGTKEEMNRDRTQPPFPPGFPEAERRQ